MDFNFLKTMCRYANQAEYDILTPRKIDVTTQFA